MAHEESILIMPLQLLDLPADRSLRAAQVICRLADAAEIGCSDERLEPG
jgi:hypothetical protein